MTGADRHAATPEALDVRSAAELVGRHPETVRRWVWSGRLPAKRQGTRLLILREDLEAVTGKPGAATLAEWAGRALATRRAGSRVRSAADLVIADRAHRSRTP